jgi:PAS domain S-box-containing protein
MMTPPFLLPNSPKRMKEIVQVKLENEMDLILAHKRAMKICELTGFSLISQTSIATAISEIARCAIDYGKNACLILGIESLTGKKYLKAIIRDNTDFTLRCVEACSYAKRLVDDIEVTRAAKEIQIILKQQLSFSGTLSDAKIDSFVDYFKNEPPLSPYDELRRKNLLLHDLAEKIRESESDYRTLTDTLPLMMFSVDNRGHVTYTNKWLQDFLGNLPKELTSASWQPFIHSADYQLFNKDLNNSLLRQCSLKGQFRLKEKATGNFVWHMMSVVPLKNEKDIIQQWIGFFVDIHAQKQVEQTLKDNRDLKTVQDQLFRNQEELQQKIIELNRSNYELEQFAHLASHDLQEPLRKLFFYSDVLKRKYEKVIDAPGVNMLNNMTMAAGRMKELINDLLNYSQLQKQKLQFETVDLQKIIHDILRDLDVNIRDKKATFEMVDLPVIKGNPLRIRQLFLNLISNSLKYSRPGVPPVILIKARDEGKNILISVRDNGIGFEDKYKEKIFGLFERLHTRDEIPGTGIGLSICKRIVELHNGNITARSVPNDHTVFEVSLPVEQQMETLLAVSA